MPAVATSAASVKSVSSFSKLRSKVSLSRFLNRKPKQNQVYQNPNGNYSFTSSAYPGLVGQPGRFPQGNYSTPNLPQFGHNPQGFHSTPNLPHYNSAPPSPPMHPARANSVPAHLQGKTIHSAPDWQHNVPYYRHTNMPEGAQPIRSDLPPQQLSGHTGAQITEKWQGLGRNQMASPPPPRRMTEMEELQQARLRSPIISQPRPNTYTRGDDFMPPSSNFTPSFSATKPDTMPPTPPPSGRSQSNPNALPDPDDGFMLPPPLISTPPLGKTNPGAVTTEPTPPNSGNFSALPLRGDDFMPHTPVASFPLKSDTMPSSPGSGNYNHLPVNGDGFIPSTIHVRDFAYPSPRADVSTPPTPAPLLNSPIQRSENNNPYLSKVNDLPSSWSSTKKQEYLDWERKFEGYT